MSIPKLVHGYLGLTPGSRVSFARTPAGTVELRAEEAEQGPSRPSALSALRGHAGRGGFSTDEIMALTRGEE